MAYSWPAGGGGVDRGMSPNTEEEDEVVPQGRVTKGKDGKVGRDERIEVWGRGRERWGGRKGGGNYCTACFLS